MTDIRRNEDVMEANLFSLHDYLEQRHGPAMAQVLMDDLVTRESIQKAA